MSRLLVVVDFQNGFVDDNGSLTCGKIAQDIAGNIERQVSTFEVMGDDIVFTLDWHEEDTWDKHPESTKFNKHCMAGTWDAELYGNFNKYMNKEGVTIVQKSAYCMPFRDIRKLLARGYESIEFAGVTTDICVLQNVIGFYTDICQHLRNRIDRPKLVVDTGCVASFNEVGHIQALNYMGDVLGVEVIGDVPEIRYIVK